VALVIVLLTSVAAVDQGVALAQSVDQFAEDLPEYADSVPDDIEILGLTIEIGSRIEGALEGLTGNLGRAVQTAIDLIVGFAAGAATFLGWSVFAVLVSFFVLQSAGPKPSAALDGVTVPGYGHDVRRLQREMKKVWRAYLGGMITLSFINFIAYLVVLWVLGVENALALAVLAAVARFIPYVGALVSWTVTALVVLFQGTHILGLGRWEHLVIVLFAIVLVDQALDQFVTPKIMGQALGVHPAAVMVAVIIAAGLIGPVGLILASPVLASVWLFVRYVGRKMLDLDPWPKPSESG
jgi:predicted PurR-regulated permease PerM